VSRGVDHAGGHDSGRDDLPGSVHVGHERVQGTCALSETGGQGAPLTGFEHARDRVDVKRGDSPRAAEANAASTEINLDGGRQGIEVHGGEGIEHARVVGPRRTWCRKRFVVGVRCRNVGAGRR
jgi:alkylation response protein AidB-like acyl-CoA dehydrogenase